MTATAAPTWVEHNQQQLGAAIGSLLDRLDALTRDRPGVTAGFDVAVPALDTVAVRLELSPFERGILLLAAAIDFNGATAKACAVANGDAHRAWPTFGLALAALPDGHWSALAPGAPLRRYRLVDVDPGDDLTRARLRVDERIAHVLVGIDAPDMRLAPFVVERQASLHDLPASQAAVVEAVARDWSTGHLALAQICGADRDHRRAVIDGIARATGSGRVLEVDASALPAVGAERDDLLARMERECLLDGTTLSVRASSERPDADRHLLTQMAALNGMRGVIETDRRVAIELCVPVHDVPTPTVAEQRRMWSGLLPGRGSELAAALAATFVVSADVATSISAGLTSTDDGATAFELCRSQLRTDVGGAAVIRRPSTGWDRLVLPDDAMELLRALEIEARHKAEVHERWGLDLAGSRARGTSALFCGPSGTGKTLAAEVLAHSLGVDLLHVDLSQVVNKYIGETEKNLARVFDAGERSGAVLLFDEADALFGKRTDIKDSHDRYANIEVSYLLQRMEAYSGVAVLTTNMRANLDPAFVRRLRFIVAFPHPSREERVRIWSTIWPPGVDLDDLDFGTLAGLDISGGVIANIALGAAFRAAADGGPITMPHVRAAAELEYLKLERPLTDAELGGWPR